MLRAFAVTAVFVSLGTAHAYEFKTSGDGEPLRWGEGTLKIHVATEGGPLPAADVVEALQRACEPWETVMPAEVEVSVNEVAGAPPVQRHDRANLVRWVTEGWDE